MAHKLRKKDAILTDGFNIKNTNPNAVPDRLSSVIDTSEQALKVFARARDTAIAFRPGAVITGQFEVVRVLGKGGMGVVYEVIDLITRQRLALKTIRPSLLARRSVLEYFIQEVSLARRLRHPNIVAVYDVRQQGPLLFFTMEYLEGRTLRDLLVARGPLSVDEAVSILRPLCFALEHAHQFTVHRDVSPENIMVGDEGVKLLDFGIAKALGAKGPVRRSVGKAFYAAPEQREDSPHVDARADIYSLGVIFCEMLTRKAPKKPVSVATALPSVTPECRAVILRSVAPLDLRYNTVSEFRAALDRCLGLGADAAEQPTAVGRTTPSNARPTARYDTGTPHDSVPPHKRPSLQRWASIIVVVAAAVLGPLLTGYVLIRAGAFPARTPRGAPQSVATPPAQTTRANPPQPAPNPPPKWDAKQKRAELRLPNGATMEFIRIRMGTFTMGQGADRMSDVGPAHEVTLTKGFWMSTCEVTQAHWEAVMETRPWRDRPQVVDDRDAPAVYVSWFDAQEFTRRLDAMQSGRFRLPSEAEWEYACRADRNTDFPYGDDPAFRRLSEHAWFYQNTKSVSAAYGHRVAQKTPNPWGLCDMHGNVAEWCADWYDASYYANAPISDPGGPLSGSYRTLRGGSWADFGKNCASYSRGKAEPLSATSTIGFRVCRDL